MIPLQFGLIAILTLIATPYVSDPHNPINVCLGNIINRFVRCLRTHYTRFVCFLSIFLSVFVFVILFYECLIMLFRNESRNVPSEFDAIPPAAEDEPITTVPEIQDPELRSMPLATILEHESEFETESSVLHPINLSSHFEAAIAAEEEPITNVPGIENPELIFRPSAIIPEHGSEDSIIIEANNRATNATFADITAEAAAEELL